MNDVVVGIDRSETAGRAARRAAELAAAFGANLHLVMCVERTPPIEFGVGSDRFRIDALSEADAFLLDVGRSLHCERVTHAVGLGDPAGMLCAEAARLDARAVVVGNRRVQGVSRVLGSVAGDVTKSAPCDVLVVNTCGSDH